LTADITTEFKDIEFTTTTTVKAAEVGDFIDQASFTIDSFISSRYSVPVTAGAGAVLVLKMICIWLVKARVLSILSVKTPQDKTKQDPDGPSLYKQAMDLMKIIKNGQLPLVGATLVSSDDGMSSFLMNEELTHDFRVGENDW